MVRPLWLVGSIADEVALACGCTGDDVHLAAGPADVCLLVVAILAHDGGHEHHVAVVPQGAPVGRGVQEGSNTDLYSSRGQPSYRHASPPKGVCDQDDWQQAVW